MIVQPPQASSPLPELTNLRRADLTAHARTSEGRKSQRCSEASKDPPIYRIGAADV
jgi:hypothetical protein